MKLWNQSKNILLSSGLELADSFGKQFVGMMGRKQWPQDYGLWIYPCKSIHTHFMRIAIDVVFVNKENRVEKIYWALPPWRMTWPQQRYQSVFEFPTGRITTQQIETGDLLYVET